MRVLFIGDIVGRPGRQAAVSLIPGLRNELDVDFVIANGENAAGGVGITPTIADDLLNKAEIDTLTLGNHTWAKREIYPYLRSETRILRPANYPPGVPGVGAAAFETTAGMLGVLVLQGRVFMEPVDDPFRTADLELARIADGGRAVIIDFHAEATSEKAALGAYLDGRVSAVIGTHTHVQTADERILPGGTAFITDVGMTGPTGGIIGMQAEPILSRFLTGLPNRFEVAEGQSILSGALVEIDEATGRARSIMRIQRAIA